MADSARNVREPKDLDELGAILRALQGKRCWRARLGYGDELRLEFGAKIPYRNPLLAAERRGEWTLGGRASPWTLTTRDEPAPLSRIEGLNVVEAGVRSSSLDLRLTFQDGTVLEVVNDPAEHELAAWELFTPDGMVLRTGPGLRWSYQRGDLSRGDRGGEAGA